MATTHNLGFPRIGTKRELKRALERYWQGNCSAEELLLQGAGLREQNWRVQASLDYAPVGDFSLYDHVLDVSAMVGNLPARAQLPHASELDTYFRAARGRAGGVADERPIPAAEMTKWFDTNYHYIVPEFTRETTFQLNPERLLGQLAEAKALGVAAKPILLGPVTYLWLGKAKDGSERRDLLQRLVPIYAQVFEALARQGANWVQVDEPILGLELDPAWQEALRIAYTQLSGADVKLLLTTYFGRLQENLPLACSLPVDGLHLDAVNGKSDVQEALRRVRGRPTVLSLGIINGRNIWKSDLTALLAWLEPISAELGPRLWLAPSCSLQHVPVDLAFEVGLDSEVRSWLAFAVQKLEELAVIAKALSQGRATVAAELEENQRCRRSREHSAQVHRASVKQAVAQLSPSWGARASEYSRREAVQRKRFRLPHYPTTTIGSFPQTAEIRRARQQRKNGELDEATYRGLMQAEVKRAVAEQERIGLDVLVHGEAERNDMVEYFGEFLEGIAFSANGWVQSYGSRCVKPPILYGDISRPAPMTVEWAQYAQSLTQRPMKGMLTGPVTILNWSFVRDDQPRSVSCYQLALAIRQEVLDLEAAGITIIQIDEAALREGLPLRPSEWDEYLTWAVDSFRITAGGVKDETQIHTHMCYSEFNDIMPAIARMDADVITIETSRSDMELLEAFKTFDYPNQIGPGVYDIHSPNVPTETQIVALMRKAAEHIPAERLWVNPDCGLKTRAWAEVLPALEEMVQAARTLRASGEP